MKNLLNVATLAAALALTGISALGEIHTTPQVFNAPVDHRGGLKIDGTAVTASADELNKMDGVTLTTAQINAAGSGSTATITPSLVSNTAMVVIGKQMTLTGTATVGNLNVATNAVIGNTLTIVEGALTDSTIVAADIKDGEVGAAELANTINELGAGDWSVSNLTVGSNCSLPAGTTCNSIVPSTGNETLDLKTSGSGTGTNYVRILTADNTAILRVRDDQAVAVGSMNFAAADSLNAPTIYEGSTALSSKYVGIGSAGSLNTLSLTNTGTCLTAAGSVSLPQDAIALTNVAASGNGAAENGVAYATEKIGCLHHTRITLTNIVETATDGTDEGESQIIYTFTEGAISILGATINSSWEIACVGGTSANIEMAIGSAEAADDSALTSTEADIIPSTGLAGGAGTVTNTFAAILAAPLILDGTGAAKSLYLNIAIDDDDMDQNVVFTALSGYLDIYWVNVGDK